jgi:hypothetical protein
MPDDLTDKGPQDRSRISLLEPHEVQYWADKFNVSKERLTVGGDPIKMGLVDSLNRPGGNITGVSFLSSDIVAKMMEAMHELMPKAARIAALVNPTNQNAAADTKTGTSPSKRRWSEAAPMKADSDRLISVHTARG